MKYTFSWRIYWTKLERLITANNSNNKEDKITIPWFIYQILQGIHYLHSCKIMHRDRSSNILVDEKGNIKICGFGNAINFDNY